MCGCDKRVGLSQEIKSFKSQLKRQPANLIGDSIRSLVNDFVNHFDHTLNVTIQTNNSIPNVLNCFLTGLTAAVQNLDKEKLAKVLENIN